MPPRPHRTKSGAVIGRGVAPALSINRATSRCPSGRACHRASPRSTERVVVEDRYSALLGFKYGAAGFLPDLLARVQVRYPEIPIFFADTRALAEEWTYRYLGAAVAELHDGAEGS